MTIVFLILGIIALVLWFKFRKIPKFGNLVLVTGGIKTGKSMLSVWLAYRQYKRQLRKYYIYNYFVIYIKRFFRPSKNYEKKEKPLLYSNVPLAIDGYAPLTHRLIERKDRFRYGSVVYLCEASLVADSQQIKDPEFNERMLLLAKLIGHETKGGYMFVDTQSVLDLHYSLKRTVSSYFYIHHTRKWIPFVCVMWVRELKYSEDNSSVNTFDSDVEDTLKMVIIPKKVWKMYDCYCYSAFTDGCPVEDRQAVVVSRADLKAKKIISFKKYLTLDEEFFIDYGKKEDGSQEKEPLSKQD